MLGSEVEFEVYGVDIVEELLLVAESRIGPVDANIVKMEFHALDWGKQCFQFDSTFDIILSSKVLYNTALKLSPQKFLEICNSLDVNGFFFLEAYLVRGIRSHLRLIAKRLLGKPYGNACFLDLLQILWWSKKFDWELFYYSKKVGQWTHHVRDLATHQFIWRKNQ